MYKLITVLCFFTLCTSHVLSEFLLYDQWSSVDFQYDAKQKKQDLESGKFKPDKVVIYAAELYRSAEGVESLFVTTPNLFDAAPFSLSIVNDSLLAADNSSTLVPFPDQSWYNGECNKSIISVYRVKIDQLNRLWVVDSGMVNQLTSDATLKCPPKILVFDLKNNYSLIKMYEVPDGQHYSDSLLVNIELDVRSHDGQDTMAYISDTTGFRMVVYSMKNDSSFAVDNPFFNPFPLYSFFRNISGVSFTLLNGLYAVAIAPGKDSNRLVYFHGLSSGQEGYTNLSILSDPNESHDAFKYGISKPRGFHSTVEVMTPSGFLIFTNLEKNSIMIWDTMKPYSNENFVTLAKDDEQFQFITGMQLLDGKNLLVTSSRYQNVLTGRIAKNETNYRVLVNLDISKYIKRKERRAKF